VDERAAVDAIRHVRSLGINFFDTAQAYGFGRAERLLGRALAAELCGRQEQLVIAPKGGLRMDGKRLVREGLIRHVGVSNYSTAQITEFAAALPAETVQPPMAPPRSSASACRPDQPARWP
jgi:aryl-alcohol dehydrogenase-like predicted oxidoreductase